MKNYLIGFLLLVLSSACAVSSGKENSASQNNHHANHLPLAERVAFMSGHVEAGLALYRAGKPEMAAPHLLHPVSETHADERIGLDALGFDARVFEAVSAALEQGRPAAEIEPQLARAEKNLKLIARRAGGDATDIIHYLLDVIVEEYSVGVTSGAVTDPGEYQDAYGFTRVAIARANSLPLASRSKVQQSLDSLLKMWPEAPVPPASATPVSTIEQKIEEIRRQLKN